MPSTTSSPASSKTGKFISLHQDPRFRVAVSQAVRLKVHQLIEAGSLRPSRPNKQCRGNWKPRMDLVDDPSSPNIIALFELPGVKNENITLQIKDRRLVVAGNRVDPYSEALAAATSTVSGPQTQVPPRTSSTEISQIDPSAATAASSGSISSPSLTNRSVRELRYGSFFRSIPVPDGIKQSEVNAGIQDGILTVTWPRVPASARQSVLQMTSVTGGNTSMNPVTSKATPGAEGTGLNNTMAMVQ